MVMRSATVGKVRALLRGVGASGGAWSARCPKHDDRENSLSIGEGDDGRVLLKCFAGCSADAIVEVLGLELRDLFPAQDQGAQNSPLTVVRLAEDKSLPAEFLRSLGLRDRSDGVLIPYTEIDGSPAPRNRLRTSVVAKDGSL